LGSITLPRWGKVAASDGPSPWCVVDPDGRVVEPIQRFLIDFVACGNQPTSVRSYAYGLLRWWRWLCVTGVEWNRARPDDVRDYVLWIQRAVKPRSSARTVSASTAGTVNLKTRKQYLDDRYKPRTTRHSNAVIRSFYEFWIEMGAGPLVNPVPLQRMRGQHANAHHNPMTPFRAEGRIRYNPKVPKTRPRALPDELWVELFSALKSNRDRAVLALAVSSAARASELLGVRGVDLDWGDQLVRVVRKGSRAQQWLPASPEAFVWLRLYLAELGELDPQQTIWWTLRRRDRGKGLQRQPMDYEALRGVFRRINVLLGTNWSMHDLRHTCALRMARDESLSLRDVQTILGHEHLGTTADLYLIEEDAAVIRRVATHLAEREKPSVSPPQPPVSGYDLTDLDVLFGNGAA
jgi:integrase